MWTLGTGIILNIFFIVWTLSMGIVLSFIFSFSSTRFSYFSCINWIFSQLITCHCHYALTRICHTGQWLVITCWRYRGSSRQCWGIIWTSRCKINLFWCSSMLVIVYFFIICLYWLIDIDVYTHRNISCIGIYFTCNFE